MVATAVLVTAGREDVMAVAIARVGTNVILACGEASGPVSVAASAPPLHAATTSVRNSDVNFRMCRGRIRMPILVGQNIGQVQIITRKFDSMAARLSERVHFTRSRVVYLDLHSSIQRGVRGLLPNVHIGNDSAMNTILVQNGSDHAIWMQPRAKSYANRRVSMSGVRFANSRPIFQPCLLTQLEP